MLSPGIPLAPSAPAPPWSGARATAGVEVVGDVELLVENQPQRRIVGITGTNGKSTTTALIGALLRRAGLGVQVGGNIGLPVLDLLPKPGEDIYVLELSSYQLELTEHLACTVAVILNLSPDHLDRHGGMARLRARQARILRNQQASDWAVIGVDDEPMARRCSTSCAPAPAPGAADRGRPRPRRMASTSSTAGSTMRSTAGAPAPIVDLRPIASLRGAHNWQNAAAAYAAARALGVDAATAAAAGLRALRRASPIAWSRSRRGDGVQFVNDSKATNPEAAARALASFERIYWIAGGRPKEGGPRAAAALARSRPPRLSDRRGGGRLRAGARPARALHAERRSRDRGRAGGRRRARAMPATSAVVLLTPACASFDQFTDFEARGDAFKALVARCRLGRRRAARRGAGGRPMTPVQPHPSAACSAAGGGRSTGRCWPASACWRSSGLVFVFASSPPVAARLGLPPLHFVGRHAIYLLPAAAAAARQLAAVAQGRPSPGDRRCSACRCVLLVLTLLVGPEIKGARRWLPVGGAGACSRASS